MISKYEFLTWISKNVPQSLMQEDTDATLQEQCVLQA